MGEDKDKDVYTDIMRVYNMDKDYCYTALHALKNSITAGKKAQAEERLDWLTKCLDGLTKTADIVAELLKGRLKSTEKHSNKKEND